MNINHLIDFNDIELSEWEELYKLGLSIKNNQQQYQQSCKGKILATLFYEPSTRTMLSFQTAMLRLGGSVIGFDNPNTSSVSKGENLKDTIRTVCNYADILVMRNPNEGAAFAATLYSKKPLINAGDGGHLHPTQTLADLFTICETKKTLENLVIGVCGDLRHGRTVHSLLKAMSLFKNNKFYLISTSELKTPKYITDILKKEGNEFYEVRTIEECIEELDVIYMTRIQKERFVSNAEYEQQKNVYCLDSEKMKKAKSDMIILHPLPKVDEIDEDIDFDSRAYYFKQAENGMYIRMALIIKMLEKTIKTPIKPLSNAENIKCPNPRCITNSEQNLPTIVYDTSDQKGSLSCKYCDFKVL